MKTRLLLATAAVLLTTGIAKAQPYWPSFHNVPAQTFFANFSYYPNQGLGMRTFSSYKVGSQTLTAGSFDNGVTGEWYMLGNITSQAFDQAFQNYNNKGMRPREITVMMDNGVPKFSAIWKKRQGEAYYTYINMNDAGFDQKWKTLVEQQGFRIEDYISYTVNGQKRHAAIFVKDGQGFYMYMNMNQAGFNQRFNELAAKGFYPVSFNASQTPQGERYAGVWMKTNRPTAMYFNMSADGYQQKFDHFTAQGYRLMKVVGYGNGQRFAAIWKK